MQDSGPAAKPKVALFATCLVDLFRPQIGFAAAELIESCGFEVDVPKSQTCCAQPLISNGANRSALQVARTFIKTFAPYDFIVAPSGSCIATVKLRFIELFDDPNERREAEAVISCCYELTEFLSTVAQCKIDASFAESCAYHDSCSGLRELGIHHQPRQLLSQVEGLLVKELGDPAACCGFGGTFCVKYPEISANIVDEKVQNVKQTRASYLLGGDLGCLMNIAGTLKRQGSDVRVMHVAEVLAGHGDMPGIGEASS